MPSLYAHPVAYTVATLTAVVLVVLIRSMLHRKFGPPEKISWLDQQW